MLKAALWYDDEREGLGLEFDSELTLAQQHMALNPLGYKVFHKDIRMILLKRFPYHLFYRIVDETQIVIVACFHAHQNPANIRNTI